MPTAKNIHLETSSRTRLQLHFGKRIQIGQPVYLPFEASNVSAALTVQTPILPVEYD